MTQRMTEAARLYWKDLDVLEQARQELTDYLSTVQQAWWDRVRQLWQEDPRTSVYGTPFLGTGHKEPGHWWLQLVEGSLTGIRVDVRDARRIDAAQHFSVVLVITKADLKRLRRRGQGILAELSQVAGVAGLDFSWDDPYQLSGEHIDLDPDDSQDTAHRLAETVFRYLQAIVLLDEKLKELNPEG
jgi:hypothetical protein